MPIQISVQDRKEAVNLMAVLLAYGTGFNKAGNVLAHLELSEAYNGNAKKMARGQAQKLAVALGVDGTVDRFLRAYNPRTHKWGGLPPHNEDSVAF